jgi:hypothetical protein
MLIASLLHQDIEDDAVLVDRTPQPMTLALDLSCTSSRCHLSLGRARRRRNPAA